MVKGFSVITNFGCDTGCEYCVWKPHSLKDIITSYENCNWKNLKKLVSYYEKISISGGGDPFFEIEKNWKWFEKLFEIYNGKIDIHTSKILDNTNWDKYKYFNKLVLHLNYDKFIACFNEIEKITNPIRLVFVITTNLNKEKIIHINKLVNNKYELSFRELLGNKTTEIIELENYIKQSKYYYIEQKDYNYYYMPNNEVWNHFLTKED